jgi:hypothetical protein
VLGIVVLSIVVLSVVVLSVVVLSVCCSSDWSVAELSLKKCFNYRNFSGPLLPSLSFMFIVEEIASRHFITLMVPFSDISKSSIKAKLSGADVIKLFCP